MKSAIYARLSTVDQEPENQLQELRRYVQARGWTAVEYVDRGMNGARIDAPPSINWSLLPSVDGSMWSSAGGSIGLGATSNI